MKVWQRRVLGILALGGSFLGLSLAFVLLISPGLALLARLLVLPFIGLYCWGAWCGLRLIEGDPNALRSNRIFWALQIPYVMSPFAGYFFASGGMLFVTFKPSDINVSAFARLGSQFEYSLLQADKPLVLGVNVFAIVIVVFLTKQLRREPSNNSFNPMPLRGTG